MRLFFLLPFLLSLSHLAFAANETTSTQSSQLLILPYSYTEMRDMILLTPSLDENYGVIKGQINLQSV